MSESSPNDSSSSHRLVELARLFAKLGIVAFGGPAAHIGMMEDEVVTRRRWMSRQHFLDLVGATNLIPGPNSSEMAMHIGHERAGWRGLVTAGASFILPAVAITGVFAWAYVRYGSLPEVEPFLRGIKPAVIAVILGAVWKLGGKALKDWRLGAVGLAVFFAVLFGAPEIPALLGGGLVGMLWLRGSAGSAGGWGIGASLLLAVGDRRCAAGVLGVIAGPVAAPLAAASAGKLFLFFLKVGAVLYGSGYVLVSFLEGGLVQEHGWLTQPQLLDAIALGQLTPGPVLSSATFIGYLVAGAPGAAASTVGIFLPSFFFVLALNPLIPRLRRSPWAAAFLDAVNAAAVALMAAVVVDLGRATLTSWPAWVIALVAVALVVRLRVNAAWLVAGGAVVGWVLGPWM